MAARAIEHPSFHRRLQAFGGPAHFNPAGVPNTSRKIHARRAPPGARKSVKMSGAPLRFAASPAEAEKAVAAARSIAGVKVVRNDLKVKEGQ